MIKKIFYSPLLLLCLFSCTGDSKKAPVTDIEVATTFIRDILDNKFDEAEQFLLKDETNNDLFKRFKSQYKTKNKQLLEKYKASDIIVNEIAYVTDTIYIFNYSNSYLKDVKNKLKLVRIDNKWLVDLKYTFSGNL